MDINFLESGFVTTIRYDAMDLQNESIFFKNLLYDSHILTKLASGIQGHWHLMPSLPSNQFGIGYLMLTLILNRIGKNSQYYQGFHLI